MPQPKILVVAGDPQDAADLQRLFSVEIEVVCWGTALTGDTYDVIIMGAMQNNYARIQYYCESLRPILNPNGRFITL